MPKTTHELITCKTQNFCFVKIDGRIIYCGRPGEPETMFKYHQIMLDFYSGKLPKQQPTVAELCASYTLFCEDHYDGSTQQGVSQAALKRLLEFVDVGLYDLPPRTFKAWIHWLEDQRSERTGKRLSRKTIKEYSACIRRMVRWAVSEELVEHDMLARIETVQLPGRGRSKARESRDVQSVSKEHIDAVQKHVSRQVWSMISLQLLTAARPGEIVSLRPMDIDRTGDIWTCDVVDHKNSWRGKDRTLYFGPQAQTILREYLVRPVDAYLFSPREASDFRALSCLTHRHKSVRDAIRKTNRRLGDSYTTGSYRHAITRACDAAGIPHWSPNQLRHTAATRIRAEFGLEAAQVVLGHACADVTQIYAERDARLAMSVIQKIG